MKLLDWFTSGGKNVQKITDAAIASGDALIYTEEERAATAEKQRELYFKFLELSRDENSIKSVTRRIITFAILAEWFMFLNLAALFKLIQLWFVLFSKLPEEELTLTVAALGGMADWSIDVVIALLWIIGAVVSFYYGANILNGKMGKFSKLKEIK